ncbi:MAG: hypothetical protein HOP15_12630 [Planctomycetes bacterium]|nr:hypothetical protein [Planctomycetota bacterium]
MNTRPGLGEEHGAGRMLTLPHGSYDLWVQLTTDEAPAGLAGSTSVDFDPGRLDPIAIELLPAAAISGVLRDRAGAPLPHRVLSWTSDPWPLGGQQAALYGATTDAQGAFTLLAVPARTPLRGAQPGTDLSPFEPGPHEGIELVSRP